MHDIKSDARARWSLLGKLNFSTLTLLAGAIGCSAGSPPSDDAIASVSESLSQVRYDNLPDVAEFVLDGRSWDHRNLTYFFANGTSDIPGTDEQQSVRDAMTVWSLESPLTFSEVSLASQADIEIEWGILDHGDGHPFDGTGGPFNELAHTFFPPPDSGSFAGDMHFDDDETWTTAERTTKEQPIDLVSVATHELGHSIGLQHSLETNSLMDPIYQKSRRLSAPDDVDGVQVLYGSAMPFAIRARGTTPPSVFIRGGDNTIWENYWNGSDWTWASHGESINGTPAAMIVNGVPNVFVRTWDGSVLRHYLNGTTWQTEALGGVIAGTPSAIAWGSNKYSVFVRGSDNGLWELALSGTSWNWTPHGDSIMGTPFAVATGATNLSVVVLRTDRSLAERTYNGSTWSWVSRGGSQIASVPGAAASSGKATVFVRGGDGALWENTWNGSDWHWSPHGGAIRGIPAVESPTSVFVRASNDTLYQNWWNGTNWVWTSHGGSCTTSPTATAVDGVRRVFVRTSTGAMSELYLAGGTWLWRDHAGTLP